MVAAPGTGHPGGIRFENIYGASHYKKALRKKQDLYPDKLLIFSYTFYTYALDRYSPERVSILIFSPCSTKSGTATCAPVSTIAGFVAP